MPGLITIIDLRTVLYFEVRPAQYFKTVQTVEQMIKITKSWTGVMVRRLE